MLIWETQTPEILSRIRANKSEFKIVLKTKDEPFFLKDWVTHHRRIVGDEGLIIFDNGSTDPAVLGYYDSLDERILVIRFSLYMNDLHRPYRMPGLYGAMRESSVYFTFIDSDEFLYWFTESGQCLSGTGFRMNLMSRNEPVIPGLWLDNVTGYRDRLWLADRPDHMVAAVRSGKPVISGAVTWDGMSNHNFHMPPSLWDRCVTGNVIVAHMRNLDPQQRIRANMAKLRSDRVIGPEATVEDVLAMDDSPLWEAVHQYVFEIRTLTQTPFETPDPEAEVEAGQILIHDGKLFHPSEEEETALRRFLADPAPLVRAVLGGAGNEQLRRSA